MLRNAVVRKRGCVGRELDNWSSLEAMAMQVDQDRGSMVVDGSERSSSSSI